MSSTELFSNSFENTLEGNNKSIDSLRIKAFKEFKKIGIPNRKQEYWKFSDPSVISRLDLELEESTEMIDEDYDVILSNGKLVKLDIKAKIGSISEGIACGDITENVLDLNENPFINLNSAFAKKGCYILLEKNSTNKIRILNSTKTVGSGKAIYPRIVIIAGENSKSTVFEEIRIGKTGTKFVNSVTNIFLDKGANLEHIIYDDYSDNSYQISNILANLKRDSNYVSHNFSIAKSFSRRDYHIELAEIGSNCDLNGLYFANNENHIDHHTTIEHIKNNCTSNEHYKGILGGKSVAVFNGRIHVHPDAQKTDAIQNNQNLLLSDDTIIHAKPELEIYADDVKCTHGATVGQLDDKAMFYLRARGLNENEAKRILMRAYVGEVIDKIKDKSFREQMMTIVLERLPNGD